jgi:methylenetetrahydrofolate dehydrogenase (NADP+)/methenyltetrahydrofolate cyclohydrolase
VGIKSIKKIMAVSISKEELLQQIAEFNKDDGIDGILLQLPLPDHLREFTQDIVDSISVDKDVDGLTTANLGRLLSNSKSAIHPCTPKGCMELLKRYGIKTEAKRVLVIGRSTLVGLPISILLNQANATVIMAHSRTANLEEECKNADIIVAAIGKPNYIQGSWLKPGAVVIDVGINAVMQVQADGSELKKIVGDVDFKTASEKASFITPVPGGVGLMTVAMLLSNTMELYLRKIS